MCWRDYNSIVGKLQKKKKYLRIANFLTLDKKAHHSLAWKGLLHVRDILIEGLLWIVDDGRTILFWNIIGYSHSLLLPFPLGI